MVQHPVARVLQKFINLHFILVYSRHVSAFTGHPQAKYNITLFEVPSMLQRIRCSLIVTHGGVSHPTSIYNLNFSLN
jgi:hypothetical protein